MIIEYNQKYDEQIKDLLLELGEYIAKIDKEGYNVVENNYKEEYFKKTMEEIKKCNGKMMLYVDEDRVVRFNSWNSK